MEYLQKEDIVLINRLTIKKHGGNFVPPFNFLNEGPLDYLLEAVQAQMFDTPLYPEIHEKAGLYMYNIISNHVFQDGNKRTGLGSALLFLKLNGYRLKDELIRTTSESGGMIPDEGQSSPEILIAFTLEMAAGKISLEKSQEWFRQNIVMED
jgi:death-on-curing protein